MSFKASPQQRGHRPRRAVWTYLTLLALAATSAGCLLVDHTVSGWFRTHPCAWDSIVWVDAFKRLGKAGTPVWLLLVWSCLTNRWRPTLVTCAALILVGVAVCPLKALVRRCRPNDIPAASASTSPQEQDISWHEKVSFPSGDTAVTFAAALTLSFFLSKFWTPALFAMAGAVGLLRVTALAHYPSDVVAGALIGILCGMAALRYTAFYPSLDQFRIPKRWRFVAALGLILIVPIISPYIGMASLQVFLHIYAIPLAVLALLGWAATRRPAPSTPQAEAVWERLGPQSQDVATGGNPASASDYVKGPAS